MVLAGTTGGAVNERVREMQAAHRQTATGKLPLGKRSVHADLKERAQHLEFLYRSIGRLNPPRPKDFLAPIAGYRGSSAELLAGAGFPVLFLVGRHDTVTPPEIIEQCHKAVTGSQLEVIEDSGHSTYFEAAPEFNEHVGAFLAEHSPERRD